jgi:hypothetical protein
MDITNKISNFITEDIAYFLGLVVGRGIFIKGTENIKLMIEFPFKNLEAVGITSKYNVPLYLSNSVDKIVSRLKKLGLDIEKNTSLENKIVSLIIKWQDSDISFQFLHFLLNGDRTDYHSFRIPQAIYESDKEKQKEFLRGYFDVTGHIRLSNRDQGGQHRIYLEVDHKNWLLVADLFILLEKHLGIPIQTINFGHPNFRGKVGWAKEHQIKIFVNQFLSIGSYIAHKDRVIKELAKQNRPNIGDNKQEPRIKIKPTTPEEISPKLPAYLRGKHFNHSSELLNCLLSQRKNG